MGRSPSKAGSMSKAVIGHGGPVEPVRPGVLVVFSVIF